jgi:outer membrane protein assembly factor BamB
MLKRAIVGATLALASCAGPTFFGSAPRESPAARPMAGSIPLNHPIGLAEDKAGNLYVANAGSSQILVYNSKNEQLGSKTITAGVDQPADLAFDGAGDLYASQRSSDEVTVYAASGKQITSKTLHTDKSTGYAPSGVAFGVSGAIWVASRDNTNYDVGEVQVFTASGKVVHSSSQELDYPLGIVFQGADTWVFDSAADALTVFDSSAKLVKVISTPGISPTYAAKDAAGDFYVTDQPASLIAVVDASGKVTKTMKSDGLDNPEGIAFNHAGDFYVANAGNNTITEYDSHGALIHTIK